MPVPDTPTADPPALNADEIVAYYDHCQVDYTLVWHLKSRMCMHYGYWEPDTRRLRDALVLMNRKVAEHARIRPSDRVFDAGCGVGGSAIFLARQIGCRVHGSTLSEKQVRTARANAQQHGVAHLTTFDRRNYLDTGFPDASFDVVWAIESVCYAVDKADFLREAYRILKPGGRLVVADFFRVPLEPGSEEERLMRRWTDTWAITDYAVTEDFEQAMRALGYAHVRVDDVSRNVEPSVRRLYYCFFPGIFLSKTFELLGVRNERHTANTWSTYLQYKTYRRGLWRYNIFSGEKSGAA